jgi:hypothetical protein
LCTIDIVGSVGQFVGILPAESVQRLARHRDGFALGIEEVPGHDAAPDKDWP